MLIKFTQCYKGLTTGVNPARVDYIESADDGNTFIFFNGIGNRIKVFGTVDEVAAKLNGRTEER